MIKIAGERVQKEERLLTAGGSVRGATTVEIWLSISQKSTNRTVHTPQELGVLL